ncbi:hypothetical protein ACFFX1_02040 [Dactylosporangium sucinum]|uniref:Uncharacterized protein n=1 Tax=Dactylosporangium sucinum TaxID=1424081 RepID=A0A917T3R1_9ACTN|nr:hypothetical protein [Dactylosporangium sucinum]GGM08353.1 hypothetical protein GCM10007977_006720 [Dactylosporangium sucinum]
MRRTSSPREGDNGTEPEDEGDAIPSGGGNSGAGGVSAVPCLVGGDGRGLLVGDAAGDLDETGASLPGRRDGLQD